MSTTDTGRRAEKLVADKLKVLGHKIIKMNWKTRWCEIDIVSTHKKVVYFTEVKFRGSDAWGDGLSYITKTKQRQMSFAAEMWLHKNNWKNESQLQAASVNQDDEIEIVEL